MLDDLWIGADFAQPSDPMETVIVAYRPDTKQHTTVARYNENTGWTDVNGNPVPAVEYWRMLPAPPDMRR